MAERIFCATTWIAQRRSPAGWLGLVMIVAQILNLAGDLLVRGLVQTTSIPTRCVFGTGIVVPLQLSRLTWVENKQNTINRLDCVLHYAVMDVV
jgi:hypothetical protein